MQFFGVFVIIVITVVIIQTKKKKQRKKFKTALSNHIEGFSNRTDYFENIYTLFVEQANIQKSVVDKMLQELPIYKQQFTLACEGLIALSDHNICLLSKEKCRKADFTPDSLTRDTMEALPALGKYFKEYNTLHRDIYEEILLKKFTFHINDRAFGIAFSKESDYVSKEDYEKSQRTFAKIIDHFFQDEIRSVTKQFLGIASYVNIEQSTNKKVQSFLKLAQEYSDQEHLFVKFLDIWVSKMQEIGRKYAEAHLELLHYFEGIEEKMEQHIKEYTTHDMYWLNAWAPRLDEHTQEECLRVLKLYNDGILRGAYYGRYSEPKA